jgi:sugar-specific transcriptional regulator TrmB
MANSAQNSTRKPEQLLTVKETAARLGISQKEVYRRRNVLVAKGLQERVIGQTRKYREASVDKLIAADDEATIQLA